MPLRLCCIPRKTGFQPGGKRTAVRVSPSLRRPVNAFGKRTSSQIDTHRLVPIRHLQVDQIRRRQRNPGALHADIDSSPFLDRLLHVALRGSFDADVSGVGVHACFDVCFAAREGRDSFRERIGREVDESHAGCSCCKEGLRAVACSVGDSPLTFGLRGATLTVANPIPLAAPCRNAVFGQSCGGEPDREIQGGTRTHSDDDDPVCKRVNVLHHLVQVRSRKSWRKIRRVDAIEKQRRNQANCPPFTRGIVRCRCCYHGQGKLQSKVRQGPAETDVQERYHDEGESSATRVKRKDELSYNRRLRDHKKSSDMLLEEDESEAKRDEAG